jgi:hypothetical protein
MSQCPQPSPPQARVAAGAANFRVSARDQREPQDPQEPREPTQPQASQASQASRYSRTATRCSERGRSRRPPLARCHPLRVGSAASHSRAPERSQPRRRMTCSAARARPQPPGRRSRAGIRSGTPGSSPSARYRAIAAGLAAFAPECRTAAGNHRRRANFSHKNSSEKRPCGNDHRPSAPRRVASARPTEKRGHGISRKPSGHGYFR